MAMRCAGLCWLVNQVIMRASYLLTILSLGIGVLLANPQATQTPTPDGNKPSVYLGGDNPNRQEKKDKSRVRDVKGVVRDESENPVEGALVSIRDLGNGRTITW